MDSYYVTEVREGRFTSRNLNRKIATFEGKACEVVIRPRRLYATDPQRGYLFGPMTEDICTALRDNGVTGAHGGPITDAQWYKLMCAKYLLKEQVDPLTGEIIQTVQGVSDLTKSETADFITQILQWADELGIRVREADPDYRWKRTQGIVDRPGDSDQP